MTSSIPSFRATAWAVVRSRPEWRAIYLRLGGGTKKRRKQAIVAVMRKLLVVGWAMLRDGTSYQASRLAILTRYMGFCFSAGSCWKSSEVLAGS